MLKMGGLRRSCQHGRGRRSLASVAGLSASSYADLKPQDVSYFESVMTGGTLVQGEDDMKAYNNDWMNKYSGQSKLALRPKSTEEVSKILRYCNERKIAVVPQGGNTGLVGGSVPVKDEVRTRSACFPCDPAGFFYAP